MCTLHSSAAHGRYLCPAQPFGSGPEVLSQLSFFLLGLDPRGHLIHVSEASGLKESDCQTGD